MLAYSIQGRGNELNAPAVANLFFEHAVLLCGVLHVVLHDHNPRFSTAFNKELYKILGCKTMFLSTFHPQNDGQMNRHNRNIEQDI